MRLGILVFFSTLFLILSACTGSNKPECLIPKAELSTILANLHVAEKRLDYSGLTHDSAYAVYHGLYKQQILDSAGRTVTCFEGSMNYYIANPEKIEEVYKMVVDTLVKRNSRLDSLEKHATGVVEP